MDQCGPYCSTARASIGHTPWKLQVHFLMLLKFPELMQRVNPPSIYTIQKYTISVAGLHDQGMFPSVCQESILPNPEYSLAV